MAEQRGAFTIAIDGPAGAGKSTVGEGLADALDATFFDTGVLYRAVTYSALKLAVPLWDAERITAIASQIEIRVTRPSVDDGRQSDVLVDGEDVTWAIRSPDVDRSVSEVSAHGAVRKALLPLQRQIGRSGRVVMVGRDIGTVVMPDADVKIYLDASLHERARRRAMQLSDSGRLTDADAILDEIVRRDRIDSERAVSPLKPAEDAIIVMTDGQSIEDVIRTIEHIVDDRLLARTATGTRG